MVQLARALNRDSVASGVLELRVADINVSAIDEAAFDRIYSVHSIYFWTDAAAVLAKLARALRPGGTLVLAFRPECHDIPIRFRDPVYRFPHLEEVEAVLSQHGLTVARAWHSTSESGVAVMAAVRTDDTAG